MISIFIDCLREAKKFYQYEVSEECTLFQKFLFSFISIFVLIYISISCYIEDRYL